MHVDCAHEQSCTPHISTCWLLNSKEISAGKPCKFGRGQQSQSIALLLLRTMFDVLVDKPGKQLTGSTRLWICCAYASKSAAPWRASRFHGARGACATFDSTCMICRARPASLSRIYLAIDASARRTALIFVATCSCEIPQRDGAHRDIP
jgi:hypothetical protein